MPLSPCTPSSGSGKFSMGSFSPVGLHVLVVDDDPLGLMVLERMLRQCNYNVTTCNRVNKALQLLREKNDEFDLVMSDVYMPDEDGFKLLETIGLELDLPVIMMSANGETSVVMQGITHGACDYLIKPIRIEELRNIWQHVIRRKGKEIQKGTMPGELDDVSRGAESQEQCSKKRKEFFEMEDCCVDGVNNLKKARVNWSIDLHRQFVDAVNQLGIDKAVPKRILDIMNVQGLTRENVASHLQKYRLYLKRLSGVVPEPCPIASFQASGDGLTGGTMMVQPAGKALSPSTGVKGRNLGAGIGTGNGKDKKIDGGTTDLLAAYKLQHQKQAANRAQVLGALGLSDRRSASKYPAVCLQRMGSLDLKLFLDGSPTLQAAEALDDLAACSFRFVKLEDQVAQSSAAMSVSGVNSKRTYPSRQSAVNEGYVSGQWSQSSTDASEEEKQKKIGATSGADVLNIAVDTACRESGKFGKVMDNMLANKVGVVDNIGLNQGSKICRGAFGMLRRDNQGTQSGSVGTLNNPMRQHEAMEGTQQQFLHTLNTYGPASAAAYAPSLVDLADDAVSSTNVGATISSFTNNSGDALSESSFSALVQLGCGMMSSAPPPSSTPGPPPSSSHLAHNNELDISDYLQLDDGFGF